MVTVKGPVPPLITPTGKATRVVIFLLAAVPLSNYLMFESLILSILLELYLLNHTNKCKVNIDKFRLNFHNQLLNAWF